MAWGYLFWTTSQRSKTRLSARASLHKRLTDTGEDSKLVHRWKRPEVDTLFSSLFSDASERRVWLSAESKLLASTFGRFRLYPLRLFWPNNFCQSLAYVVRTDSLLILGSLKSVQDPDCFWISKWRQTIYCLYVNISCDLLLLEFQT